MTAAQPPGAERALWSPAGAELHSVNKYYFHMHERSAYVHKYMHLISLLMNFYSFS